MIILATTTTTLILTLISSIKQKEKDPKYPKHLMMMKIKH
jgi:hypothetical protein